VFFSGQKKRTMAGERLMGRREISNVDCEGERGLIRSRSRRSRRAQQRELIESKGLVCLQSRGRGSGKTVN